MPYAINAGVRIHFQTVGSGPPLLLHHWSFDTLDGWTDCGFVAALEDAYRLVLLDARGHGRSDKPHRPEQYGLQERAADVVAVLDDLGIATTHFFGYSMGGWIGFGLARYAPGRLRSLVIGGQHPFEQSLDGLRVLIRLGIERGPDAFVAMWEENVGALSERQRKRMREQDFRALLAAAQDRPDLSDVLPSTTMPCLLIAGGEDAVHPAAAECLRTLPNGRMVTLPGLDHGGLLQRSDLVVPHLRRFLEEVEGQG